MVGEGIAPLTAIPELLVTLSISSSSSEYGSLSETRYVTMDLIMTVAVKESQIG
jgi:hypothetical protein